MFFRRSGGRGASDPASPHAASRQAHLSTLREHLGVDPVVVSVFDAGLVDGARVEILAYPPTESRSRTVLATSGIADLASETGPDGATQGTELVFCVQPELVDLSRTCAGTEDAPWPVVLLQDLAGYPALRRRVFRWGQSIIVDDSPALAEAGCSGVVMAPPAPLPPELMWTTTPSGTIGTYGVVLATQPELDFKRSFPGAGDQLVLRYLEQRIGCVADRDPASVIAEPALISMLLLRRAPADLREALAAIPEGRDTVLGADSADDAAFAAGEHATLRLHLGGPLHEDDLRSLAPDADDAAIAAASRHDAVLTLYSDGEADEACLEVFTSELRMSLQHPELVAALLGRPAELILADDLFDDDEEGDDDVAG